VKVGQNGFLGKRLLNRFGHAKIDHLRDWLSILDGDENVGGL
jgi:hypothetical protein